MYSIEAKRGKKFISYLQKLKFSRNGKIPLDLSFIDVGKSCPSRECLTSQICLLRIVLLFVFRVCLQYCLVCYLQPCGYLLGKG